MKLIIDKLLLKYRLKMIIYNDKNIPNRSLHNNSNCFNTLSLFVSYKAQKNRKK